MTEQSSFQNPKEITNETGEKSKIELQKSWETYLSNNEKPDAVVIEITNFCSNNCAHCYANLSIGKNSIEMSPKTFDDCLDVISSNQDKKPEQIWLVGGEPTQHPLLEKFLQKTKEYGFQAMIVTTGENLANEEYCRQILRNADEIDVTIRGFGPLHDVMMYSKGNEILLSVPHDLSINDQIKYALKKAEQKTSINKHFLKTINGLSNITKIKKETNSKTIIGLNVDVQAMTDLYQIIKELNSKDINVENIILQIQTFSETNSHLANILPNLWRKPTAEMVEVYYKQAQFLIKKNIFKGNIEIIDQLPQVILDSLKSKGINLGKFYNPVATPAINPDGKLRQNVIKEII